MEGNNPNGDVNTNENHAGNEGEQPNAGEPKRNFDFSDPEVAGRFISEMAEKAFDVLDKQSKHFEVSTENLRLQNENLLKQNALLDKLVRKGKTF